MENIMIAACGINCAACGAYLAWKANDDALREKTAQEWAKAFGFPFKKEDINCSGCRVSDGPKIGHCSDCSFRACAASKSLPTCAECPQYACAELLGFLAQVPEAKANLEARKA